MIPNVESIVAPRYNGRMTAEAATEILPGGPLRLPVASVEVVVIKGHISTTTDDIHTAGPHEATATGLMNLPLSSSWYLVVGCQVVPSQCLWIVDSIGPHEMALGYWCICHSCFRSHCWAANHSRCKIYARSMHRGQCQIRPYELAPPKCYGGDIVVGSGKCSLHPINKAFCSLSPRSGKWTTCHRARKTMDGLNMIKLGTLRVFPQRYFEM